MTVEHLLKKDNNKGGIGKKNQEQNIVTEGKEEKTEILVVCLCFLFFFKYSLSKRHPRGKENKRKRKIHIKGK